MSRVGWWVRPVLRVSASSQSVGDSTMLQSGIAGGTRVGASKSATQSDVLRKVLAIVVLTAVLALAYKASPRARRKT